MARAKRTKRAEVRRRYRAVTTSQEPGAEIDDGRAAVPDAALPRSARGRAPSSVQPSAAAPGRPGILKALRSAASPVEFKADIRALPSVVVGSKSFWLPALVIVITTGAVLVPALASNQFVVFASDVILQPPPMIMAFLAGMLAPRAAWLMGGIVSLLAGIAYVIVVAASTDAIVTPLGFTYVVSADQKLGYAFNVFTTTPVFGVAVGAFAGFYRRFLNMSNPQRQAARRR